MCQYAYCKTSMVVFHSKRNLGEEMYSIYLKRGTNPFTKDLPLNPAHITSQPIAAIESHA